MNAALYNKAMLGAVITAALISLAPCAQGAEEAVATVARIEGSAVVSKGAQYVNGTEGLALKVGERVMSLAASTTTIQFDDGCRYVLEANQLLTIEDQSPCALGLLGSQGAPAVAGGGIGLGWVPPAAFAALLPMGAAFDTGGDNPRPPISQ